jgi:hypothetical protein
MDTEQSKISSCRYLNLAIERAITAITLSLKSAYEDPRIHWSKVAAWRRTGGRRCKGDAPRLFAVAIFELAMYLVSPRQTSITPMSLVSMLWTVYLAIVGGVTHFQPGISSHAENGWFVLLPSGFGFIMRDGALWDQGQEVLLCLCYLPSALEQLQLPVVVSSR